MQRFFEQSDLPSMIKLMLHDSAEHVIKVVIVLGLAGNLVPQTRVRKSGNGLDELAVSLLQMTQSAPPRGWTGIFHWRKILLLDELDGCPTDASQDGIIPSGDMQDKLPNAVRILDWPGSGNGGSHTSQQFPDGISMPGISL